MRIKKDKNCYLSHMGGCDQAGFVYFLIFFFALFENFSGIKVAQNNFL